MSNKKPYITVYKPIAGWKAVCVYWNEEDGFWEPWQTDYFAYKTKAEAEKAGRHWAEAEELEFRPYEGEDESDAPDKSVTEQLMEILPNAEVVDLSK